MFQELSELDEYLFHEGKHHHAYKFLGAHAAIENGESGIRFTTWAPNASKIVLVGDFSYWQSDERYALRRLSHGGLWCVFVPGLCSGMPYKFAVTNGAMNHTVYKCDPYAVTSELRPKTASVINVDTEYSWNDASWLEERAKRNHFNSAMNTYELHLASWKTKDGNFMTYDELSVILPEYVHDMNFTHVELMPLSEHPLDASWGYQTTGYYSVTSRHGDLLGLKKLIDRLHSFNIGVLLDWVPGHFCKDEHGLINFDGGATYEYPFHWKTDNKGWGTHNFDLGRNEVRCFLISNAVYWIEEFHFDGLRVDAVSNILYLSYGRNDSEWHPNYFGSNENLEGVNFFKEFNYAIKHECPGVITIAEESSAWPQITTPVEYGGLGFDFKWNMGWMNDTLRYVELDPIYRKYHHNLINFAMIYHYSEKFVLPISHDEVVHGKKALIDKMWGDLWNKYAALRLYSTFMIGHPGKKLLFMGTEFGQFVEWREHEQLQWHVLDEYHTHRETQHFFRELNKLYKAEPALWALDYDHRGFRWIDADNDQQSVLSFVRNTENPEDTLVIICNFTPMVYYDYVIGVPVEGSYCEIFNSDNLAYGGSGQIHSQDLLSNNTGFKDLEHSIKVKIPPMAALILKKIKSNKKKQGK
ncbi:MAG: 1,4-alpha-glucan branching protein GlgB [Burkholderiales bacterium]|nr:1,4-alpha-glucan branching protein GlgB [Burkholderiales bacterium]